LNVISTKKGNQSNNLTICSVL